MSQILRAKRDLGKHKDLKRAEFLKRFFKTGKGQYAEGDNMLGINVPVTKSVAKAYLNMSVPELAQLLKSKWHEERLMALFILNHQFKRGDEKLKKKIYELYLKHIAKYVNNWDLVDLSAEYIVGPYLENRPRKVLHKLARSKNLWERRVSMISTLHFIRNNDFAETQKIALVLMNDTHDLIHKAVGWMLREMGKRSESALTKFLNKYATKMPRTMLRYAIEKYPEPIRKKYLMMKHG